MAAKLVSRRAVCAGAGAAFGLSGGAYAQRPTRPPNFLFIMADDLGYADLSCYGRRDYRTPALDRLAQQGMRFTDAYANSPVCSATRLALITGRYQYRLPAGLEEPIGPRDVGLPPEHPTLPSLLRDAGYQTALIGKWHLGDLPRFGPLQSGYEHFYGFRHGGLDYFTHDNRGRPGLWDGDHTIEQDGYLTDLLAERTIETIGEFRSASRPFLISLHFSAPHWPWEGPDDQAEAERLAQIQNPVAPFHYDGGSLATYAAMVQRMDMQIGRILSALRRTGLDRDTVVVFTSDNGGERFSDTWPFSGRKTELLEGGIRIPTIVRWPRRIPAGAESSEVVMSMDWMPTFLSLAGVSAHPDFPLEGVDLSRVLLERAQLPQRTVFWRYMNLAQEACRKGQWKYLKILENTFLFDLAADPLERANLKQRHPDIFAALVREYRAWNEQMLPLDPRAFAHISTGADIADRFGVLSMRTGTPSPD